MPLLLSAHGRHVAVLTIDNQPRRNAMPRVMLAELAVNRMLDNLNVPKPAPHS